MTEALRECRVQTLGSVTGSLKPEERVCHAYYVTARTGRRDVFKQVPHVSTFIFSPFLHFLYQFALQKSLKCKMVCASYLRTDSCTLKCLLRFQATKPWVAS